MRRNWDLGFPFRGLYLALIWTGPVKTQPKSLEEKPSVGPNVIDFPEPDNIF